MVVWMTTSSPNFDGMRKFARTSTTGNPAMSYVFSSSGLRQPDRFEHSRRALIEVLEVTREVDDAGRIAVAPLDAHVASDGEHAFSSVLKQHRDALPAADAGGRDAVAPAGALQLARERERRAARRTRPADGRSRSRRRSR